MARRAIRQFPKRSSNKSWAGAVDMANGIAGASTKVLLGSISASVATIDETILRTVGIVTVKSDQGIATEDYSGAFGMMVVNDRAITAGAASIPGPITDIGDDGWFVYVPFANDFLFLDGTGFEDRRSTVLNFDSKAKRVVEDGFSIALMVESTAASEGFVLSVILRVLSMIKGTG